MPQLNFLTLAAAELHEVLHEPIDQDLLQLYTLLALTTGEWTTNENVHDAWCIWKLAQGDHDHPALIPYADLPPEVQLEDEPYRQAIQSYARRRAQLSFEFRAAKNGYAQKVLKA
jgi:uncharacterized protein (DUF1684 family)